MITKGTWVQIRSTILEAGRRAAGIPEDTAATPLVMWSKGRLLADGELGCQVLVKTAAGRQEQGILEAAEPMEALDYGQFVPELLQIGPQVRQILFGGGADE